MPPESGATHRSRSYIALIPVAGLVLLLAGFAFVQSRFFTRGCRETDTGGYMALAERIAAGGPLAVADDDPFLHQSHVWVENDRHELIPKYTPGLPALMALGLRLAGDAGAFAVPPVCGALALVGSFLLFRLLMSPVAALLGTVVLAANPMFLTYTNYPLAHAANTAAIVWGMYFLWHWRRGPRWDTGFAAGLLLGSAVAIRPTAALMFIPAAAACLGVTVEAWRHPRNRRHAASTAWLLIGCAVVPALLLVYNTRVFGSPFTTGYRLSNEQSAFALATLLSHVDMPLRSLARDGLPVFLGLGLAGMLLHRGRVERAMLLTWGLPTLALYASYYWSSPVVGSAFTRFYLCLLPAFVGPAFALLDHACAAPRTRYAAMLALTTAALVTDFPPAYGGLRGTCAGAPARTQEVVADHAARALQRGAVIFARSPAAYHIGRNMQFRLYDMDAFDPRHARQFFEQRDPSREPRQQPVRLARLQAFYTANADSLPSLMTDTVQQFLAAGRQVALITPTYRRQRDARALETTFQLKTLDEFEVVTEERPYGGGQWQTITNQWGIYEIVRPGQDSKQPGAS